MLLFGQGAHTENYFKASFISELSYELRAAIHMLAPTASDQVIELGKSQLTTTDALTKMVKDAYMPYNNTWSSAPPRLTPQISANPTMTPTRINHTPIPPVRLLTYVHRADMRAQWKNCYCEEKLTPVHKCEHIITCATMTKEEELAFMESIREELMAAINVFDPGKLELGKNQHTSKEAPTRKLKRNNRLSPANPARYPSHRAPMLFFKLDK
ncbi:hypothetical protein C2S53_001168 [Perilla frutescens var. hirtella]|uniref:Uncharacterized protein n=1 Tax=Perilla frutescens var. hirtella TaxID=608512 RepID=A0AAD4JM18_PERFH|nr:hypothetical protein C2S53_001168 [Perilla frutescens var. hirtella]